MIVPSISARLTAACESTAEARRWLACLPSTIEAVCARWSLSPGAPLRGSEASGAWVAPVQRADGTAAVLKLALPHLEGRGEIAGLRFWAADPTVRLLAADGSVATVYRTQASSR